jgi:hypothetical protein
MMAQVGPPGFFLFHGLLFAALGGYALWRMSRRTAPVAGGNFAAVVPQASAMAVDAVRDRSGGPRKPLAETPG